LVKHALAGTDTVRGEVDIFASIPTQSSPGFYWQTVSSLMSFFVAALLHPEIQIRAQEEIDAVTGRERLPTFEDRPRLPFVDAICKEVLRWRPVVPLGEFDAKRSRPRKRFHDPTAIPHAATEDNVYRGFFIPKGWLA
jgi:hypothetical protein